MAAAYRRGDDIEAFVVCLNAGEGPATLDLHLPDLDGRTLATVAPDGWPWPAADPARVVDGRVAIDLPARGARLLRAG
jgi:hypothetical protein